MKTTILSLVALTLPAAAYAAGHSDMAYCENAFFPVDTNEDGMVSTAEAATMRDAIFASLDLNGDGTIDREEYVACTTQRESAVSAMPGKPANPEGWVTLDADANETLEPREFFDRAFEAYENVYVNRTNVDTGWSEPFIAMGEGMTEEKLRAWTGEEFFSRAAQYYGAGDKDLDGMLTRDEWLARAEQYQVDVEMINGAFDSADVNADGTLDRSEVDAMREAGETAAREASDRDGFTDSTKGIPTFYFYLYAG